jgi:hypothetical protein
MFISLNHGPTSEALAVAKINAVHTGCKQNGILKGIATVT